MATTPQKLVIDASRRAPLDAELVDRIEAEALELLRAGETEKAANVMAQVAEERENIEAGPVEELVDLTEEEIAQRELDFAAAKKEAAADLRRARSALLEASDWTQLPDVPLGAAMRAAWTNYRQALRDWPATVTDPFDPPPWPEPPTGGRA